EPSPLVSRVARRGDGALDVFGGRKWKAAHAVARVRRVHVLEPLARTGRDPLAADVVGISFRSCARLRAARAHALLRVPAEGLFRLCHGRVQSPKFKSSKFKAQAFNFEP